MHVKQTTNTTFLIWPISNSYMTCDTIASEVTTYCVIEMYITRVIIITRHVSNSLIM